jgi:hypothetical protein
MAVLGVDDLVGRDIEALRLGDGADLCLWTDENRDNEMRLGGANRTLERRLVARMHDRCRDRFQVGAQTNELLVSVGAPKVKVR